MELGKVQDAFPNLYRIANNLPINPENFVCRTMTVDGLQAKFMESGVSIQISPVQSNSGSGIRGESVAK